MVSAQFMLDAESSLREALRKMSAPDPAAQGAATAPGSATVEGQPPAEALDDLFR